MKSSFKRRLWFKILLWKAYIDKGRALTDYLKYFIGLFALASSRVKLTLLIAGIWIFLCLIIGKLWYHYRLIDLENEINNIYNPFQREVRRKLKGKRFK